MDDLDRKLLNILQSEFPLAPQPYNCLGERLGISESEALERIRSLAESGIIRKIGPSFNARRLGHASALAAAKVPSGRLEEVANVINSFPQVTHNYSRKHKYNLWFTLICRDAQEIRSIVGEIKARTGIQEIHVLPAERIFKIEVNFEL